MVCPTELYLEFQKMRGNDQHVYVHPKYCVKELYKSAVPS
jgi:hypothetical protein